MNDGYDVLITGSLVSNDLIMAEHLTRNGLKVAVVRFKGVEDNIKLPEDYLKNFDIKHLYYLKPGIEFLRMARQAKLLLSITGTLVVHLGKFLWSFHRILRLPPVINLTTGSDITELAASKSLRGMAHRQYLKWVDLNWVLALPHGLQNIYNLKLKNVAFFRGFPYVYSPYVYQGNGEKKERKESLDKKLRMFHCSHFD